MYMFFFRSNIARLHTVSFKVRYVWKDIFGYYRIEPKLRVHSVLNKIVWFMIDDPLKHVNLRVGSNHPCWMRTCFRFVQESWCISSWRSLVLHTWSTEGMGVLWCSSVCRWVTLMQLSGLQKGSWRVLKLQVVKTISWYFANLLCF